MQKIKFKIIIYSIIIYSLVSGLVLPGFCLAQQPPGQIPQTIEEAQSFGMKILSALPDAVKDVWQNQALPLWQKMWVVAQNFWHANIWPKIEPWWQKFLNLLGKEIGKPIPTQEELKKEFQKEKTEMKQDLWERFKDLWR